MRRGFLAGLVLLGTLAGCDEGDLPAVACAATAGPSSPEDTLFVRPLLGATLPGDGADVLVRVDSLHVLGAVSFSSPPPPSAAAVSLALTTDATFQGCLSPSPGGFRLHAAEAPRGRLWIRVSSNRPVVVHAPRLVTPAATGDGSGSTGGPAGPGAASGDLGFLTVLPGTSARARWDFTRGQAEPR